MKMDFLGLRTLSIIQRARELVQARTGSDIDPEQLPLDDPRVFELFQKGETDGVFQFESDGHEERPDADAAQPHRGPDRRQRDVPARPDGADPHLLRAQARARSRCRRCTRWSTTILAETYGIMSYQEQVMQVLNRLGKLPLNRALTLIKAISKKKEKTIAAERPNFLRGAGENGIDRGRGREAVRPDPRSSRATASTRPTPPGTRSWPTRRPTSRCTTRASSSPPR